MSSDRFFSVDSPKAIKAQALGWLNAINYMAPAASGGAGNLCPHASPGCLALCLGWYSGQAGMISNAELETGSNATRASRVRKARMFMHDRQAFMMNMRNAINACLRKARREGLKLCVFRGRKQTKRNASRCCAPAGMLRLCLRANFRANIWVARW
jgi:hypothetical protein